MSPFVSPLLYLYNNIVSIKLSSGRRRKNDKSDGGLGKQAYV